MTHQAFHEALARTRNLAVLSGAGVSAESGIPTFRGAGGLWRTWSAFDLASPEAWRRDPGLVWEFYNYRRALMCDKRPNPAHLALARLEERWSAEGRGFDLITQNIDDLHVDAGSQRVHRLHGSLWQVRCLECGLVETNRQVPITSAYEGSGSPEVDAPSRRFGPDDLPRCACGGVQRPHVVWFGEGLDAAVLEAAQAAVAGCSLLLVVGTSAGVYPAAALIPLARQLGAVCVEVNLERTPATDLVDMHFSGKAGELLPALLG